jgi:hypothetical protein
MVGCDAVACCRSDAPPADDVAGRAAVDEKDALPPLVETLSAPFRFVCCGDRVVAVLVTVPAVAGLTAADTPTDAGRPPPPELGLDHFLPLPPPDAKTPSSSSHHGSGASAIRFSCRKRSLSSASSGRSVTPFCTSGALPLPLLPDEDGGLRAVDPLAFIHTRHNETHKTEVARMRSLANTPPRGCDGFFFQPPRGFKKF